MQRYISAVRHRAAVDLITVGVPIEVVHARARTPWREAPTSATAAIRDVQIRGYQPIERITPAKRCARSESRGRTDPCESTWPGRRRQEPSKCAVRGRLASARLALVLVFDVVQPCWKEDLRIAPWSRGLRHRTDYWCPRASDVVTIRARGSTSEVVVIDKSLPVAIIFVVRFLRRLRFRRR